MSINQQTLNQIMNEDTFKEIVEKAKEISKKQFLAFSTGTMGLDESEFENLWKIPIISSYQGNTLINQELSEEREADVLDIIDLTIDEQLGDEEGVTIPFIYFWDENTDTELGEIQNEEYSDVIVYSKKNIMDKVKNGFDSNEDMTTDEIKTIVINYVASVITHERCHANAIYRIDEGIPGEITTIYGARGIGALGFDGDNEDEAITETIAQMIMKYKEGDDIEDCLLKTIKFTKKNPLNGIDDKKVLLLMILYPEELTKWVILGAHGNSYHNLLEEKEKEIFGDNPETASNLGKTVCNYFNNMDKSNLTYKQIQKRVKMLELMAIKRDNIIGIDEIKDLAESEDAMINLENGTKELKNLVNEKTNQK